MLACGSCPDPTETEIHGTVEWKEDRGFIKGIPKDKGEPLFKLVQYGISEAKT